MITRIFVSPAMIKRNAETGKRRPTIRVRCGDTVTACHSATIEGPSRVVYDPDGQEKYGARVFVETEAKVICDESLLD